MDSTRLCKNWGVRDEKQDSLDAEQVEVAIGSIKGL